MNLQDLYAPHPVPPAILDLLALQERFGALHEEFEATTPAAYQTQDDTADWFRTTPTQRLITIGQDGTGSLYVLWCYDDLTPDLAPVGFLGSEGTGITLLAANLPAFFEFLAAGYIWGPFDGKLYPPEDDDFGDDGDEDEEPHGPAAFRAYYRERHQTPRDPRAILDEARAQHPDFAAWVERQLNA